jgi:hypothetical protein
MDVERIIDDIEQLEEMFEAPDTDNERAAHRHFVSKGGTKLE